MLARYEEGRRGDLPLGSPSRSLLHTFTQVFIEAGESAIIRRWRPGGLRIAWDAASCEEERLAGLSGGG
jgi:hypothetical protein